MLGPLSGGQLGLQCVLQLPVGPLHHPVALGGGALVDGQGPAGMVPQVGGELTALVRGDLQGGPKWDINACNLDSRR